MIVVFSQRVMIFVLEISFWLWRTILLSILIPWITSFQSMKNSSSLPRSDSFSVLELQFLVQVLKNLVQRNIWFNSQASHHWLVSDWLFIIPLVSSIHDIISILLLSLRIWTQFLLYSGLVWILLSFFLQRCHRRPTKITKKSVVMVKERIIWLDMCRKINFSSFSNQQNLTEHLLIIYSFEFFRVITFEIFF